MGSLGFEVLDPEATPETILGEPLRECLVEMVDECLRHKADGLDAEGYFANVLEPLFRRIASDCIECRPEDPIEFVHSWVEDKLQVSPQVSGLPLEFVAPLPCIKAWCARQLSSKLKQRPAMEALQAQVGLLQRQLGMLSEGLGRTAAGQSMLAAVAAGDQAAFDSAMTLAFSSSGNAAARMQAALDAMVGNGNTSSSLSTLSPSAAEAEAAETMGEVLRGLRIRGVMSASSAFQHFQPGEDGCISSTDLLNEINSFGSISPQRCARLAANLDCRGNGRIEYRDFRSKISGFLATSQDFHSSLSSDELQAIMTRMLLKLQQHGLTVSEAFREWDVNGTGTLESSEFMAGLRSLQLGLSGKEVAQVFNAMRNSNNPGSPGAPVSANDGGETVVSLQAFETAMLRGAKQNRLKDWALSSFAKLRRSLEADTVQRFLRHYAEQPNCSHMHYSGFNALVSDAEPSLTSIEIGKLWCVLQKEDGVEEPAVSLQELFLWIAPASGKEGLPLGDSPS